MTENPGGSSHPPGDPRQAPRVSAVVLAYLDEPWIEACVRSVLASEGVIADVILVDNGCTTSAVDRLCGVDRVRVLRPGRNLGFAGGCNAGAAVATGEYLALVNGDAVVDPAALARLVSAAAVPDVGVASGSIRLAATPDLLNSAGNPLHFLGLVWAGSFGVAARLQAAPRDVATASGAGMVVRRALWDQLGGFATEYFAYHEDAELSWRCRQRGLRITYVHNAIVWHRYAFARNKRKFYLLERNRLVFVLTLYERRTLLLLLPALFGFEVTMFLVALCQGWGREKVAGWRWLLRHRTWLGERRRLLQSQRTVPDRDLAIWLTGRFEPANLAMPRGVGVVNAVLDRYWTAVRRALRRPPGR